MVITGASSGIGLATAQAFASEHARLLLAARGHDALAAAAGECQQLGAVAVAQTADVTQADSVAALRERAVAAFGRIDVWVNCAAVLLFGRFEDVPPEDFRRVIETNVFGYVYGARTALSQFRAQAEGGTLINVSSVLGTVSEPYVSAYVTSKFAIRGFTACLRQELREVPNIHVCLVRPAAMDTPVYQHAGNYLGRKARSIVPVYDATRVAKAIVRLSRRPRREVAIGGLGHAMILGSRMAPALVEWAVARFGPRLQFQDQPQPRWSGNLDASMTEGSVTGGWRSYWEGKLVSWRKGGG